MKRTPYLIQRAKFSDRSWKDGIDSILSFDYMGSAEFEFGALGESLGRIRKNIVNYTYLDVPIKGKVFSVFCDSSIKSEIKTFLEDLSERKYRLKEFSGIPEVVAGKDNFYIERFNFWWDLDNDIMFWVKNNEFEKKFKEKIEPKE